MSAKQLLLGHKNIGAKAFLETGMRFQRATWGVTLLFFFKILWNPFKNPCFEQVGA